MLVQAAAVAVLLTGCAEMSSTRVEFPRSARPAPTESIDLSQASKAETAAFIVRATPTHATRQERTYLHFSYEQSAQVGNDPCVIHFSRTSTRTNSNPDPPNVSSDTADGSVRFGEPDMESLLGSEEDVAGIYLGRAANGNDLRVHFNSSGARRQFFAALKHLQALCALDYKPKTPVHYHWMCNGRPITSDAPRSHPQHVDFCGGPNWVESPSPTVVQPQPPPTHEAPPPQYEQLVVDGRDFEYCAPRGPCSDDLKETACTKAKMNARANRPPQCRMMESPTCSCHEENMGSATHLVECKATFPSECSK